jgi:hypothetical protein
VLVLACGGKQTETERWHEAERKRVTSLVGKGAVLMAAAQSLTPPVAWQSAPCSTTAAEASTIAQGCAPGRSPQGAAPPAQPQQQEQQWLQAPPPASQPAPQFGAPRYLLGQRDAAFYSSFHARLSAACLNLLMNMTGRLPRDWSVL